MKHYPACRDCKYYGRGRIALTHVLDLFVCLKKPKKNGCYYNAIPSKKACEMFEPRKEE